MRAWRKFQNPDFGRVLEPSAGEGHLACARPSLSAHRIPEVDCIEIDITKHDVLRAKGFRVVGVDFLQYRDAAMYAHIIMNPPFAEGVRHILYAWNLLWDGEIVALLNAESIRNPFSKERRQLTRLIERYGNVEFAEGAFLVPDAEHKTAVDVAIVYLRKQTEIGDLVGSFLRDCKKDEFTEGSDSLGPYGPNQPLALPNSTIENAVLSFNAAVAAVREGVFAESRARYYTRLLGDRMAVLHGDVDPDAAEVNSSIDWVREQIHDRYSDLKDRAWSGILTSTQITSRLSSNVRRQMEAEFDSIKSLEFSVSNIHGFLFGLVQNQGRLQNEMCCEVFDLIGRYHTGNVVFYKGWKSNDKHRTCGMSIKTTRFILPNHSSEIWQSSIGWSTTQMLADFDKVFALLDGKTEVRSGLLSVFESHFSELRAGERVSSDYFDVRYYPSVGTIHFFPHRKDLIDRLNRVVGRQRRWLPAENVRVPDAFWLQFEKAEQFDKSVRAETHKIAPNGTRHDPFHNIHSPNSESAEKAAEHIDRALDTVLENHGIAWSDALAEDRHTLLPEGTE
jgi:hypothetical protein